MSGIFKSDAFWGAIVGGFFSLAGVWMTNKFNILAQKKLQKERTMATISAIAAELKALKSQHLLAIGTSMVDAKAGEPLLIEYLIQEHYFSVFDANAAMIGEIEESLREEIISTVIVCKGLIDSFRMNNAMARRYVEHELLAAKSIHPADRDRFEGTRFEMATYSLGLIEAYKRAITAIDKLLSRISPDTKAS